MIPVSHPLHCKKQQLQIIFICYLQTYNANNTRISLKDISEEKKKREYLAITTDLEFFGSLRIFVFQIWVKKKYIVPKVSQKF